MFEITNICYNSIGDKMINYPNGKKSINDKIKNKANLGQSLEDDLNKTNSYYQIHKIALVHKKPTPITIVKVDYPKRSAAKIVEAYYQQSSTTDYNGIYQGIPIDFEAKSTRNKTSFPLSMIHQHQLEHLSQVIQHGGFAFLIIRFVLHDLTFLLPYTELEQYIKKYKKQSIPLKWFQENILTISSTYFKPCDYIQTLAKILKNGGHL